MVDWEKESYPRRIRFSYFFKVLFPSPRFRQQLSQATNRTLKCTAWLLVKQPHKTVVVHLESDVINHVASVFKWIRLTSIFFALWAPVTNFYNYKRKVWKYISYGNKWNVVQKRKCVSPATLCSCNRASPLRHFFRSPRRNRWRWCRCKAGKKTIRSNNEYCIGFLLQTLKDYAIKWGCIVLRMIMYCFDVVHWVCIVMKVYCLPRTLRSDSWRWWKLLYRTMRSVTMGIWRQISSEKWRMHDYHSGIHWIFKYQDWF